MIYDSLSALIGNTPLLRVTGLDGQVADILVKLEYFNPGGSVKDRIALAMIEDAEASGALQPGFINTDAGDNSTVETEPYQL